MKTPYLFPNQLKPLAWVIFIPAVIIGIYWVLASPSEPEFLDFRVFTLIHDNFFSSEQGLWIKNNILDEIIGTCIVISGIILGFSKTKMEDEYIAQLRSEALIWSTYVNYGLLLLAFIFVYGLPFLNFMLFGLFLSLILFVLIFHYKIYQVNKATKREE